MKEKRGCIFTKHRVDGHGQVGLQKCKQTWPII